MYFYAWLYKSDLEYLSSPNGEKLLQQWWQPMEDARWNMGTCE